MKTTYEKGNLSEAKFLADALEKGYTVLVPFGGGCRYDLVLDKDNTLIKIQVKTGKLKDGRITFQTTSNNRGVGRKPYHGEVDFIGVYCPQNDTSYLVPISKTGTSSMSLRVQIPKNKQVKNINLANQYLL